MWHCLADEAGKYYLLCLLDYYNYLLPTENQRDLCRILQKLDFPSTIIYICCNVARKRETKKIQRKLPGAAEGSLVLTAAVKLGAKLDSAVSPASYSETGADLAEIPEGSLL